MNSVNRARRGFTLIELLVVIAIIAILAALIFPVFNRAKERTRMTTCMSQMQAIYTAVKLYHEDNNKYPTVLASYPYINNVNPPPAPAQVLYNGVGTVLDMDAVDNRPLHQGQKLSKTKQDFHCPDDTATSSTQVTTAVYPAGVPLTGNVLIVLSKGPPKFTQNAYFYTYDSYDVGPQIDSLGNVGMPAVPELHYSLDWTGVVGPGDNPNQLKYPDPPTNSTVLTWCTFHVAEAHSDQIPVLMLNGTVKSVSVNQFVGVGKGPLSFSQ